MQRAQYATEDTEKPNAEHYRLNADPTSCQLTVSTVTTNSHHAFFNPSLATGKIVMAISFYRSFPPEVSLAVQLEVRVEAADRAWLSRNPVSGSRPRSRLYTRLWSARRFSRLDKQLPCTCATSDAESIGRLLIQLAGRRVICLRRH